MPNNGKKKNIEREVMSMKTDRDFDSQVACEYNSCVSGSLRISQALWFNLAKLMPAHKNSISFKEEEIEEGKQKTESIASCGCRHTFGSYAEFGYFSAAEMLSAMTCSTQII